MTNQAKALQTRPIRAVIVDDDSMARARLRTMLRGDQEIEVVGECGSGPDAVPAIAIHQPDLVFLDIQMPRTSRFDVLAAVGDNRRLAAVFVTAYEGYAIAVLDVQASQRMRKPFDDRRLLRAINRAKGQIRTGWLDRASLDRRDATERISVRDGRRTVSVALSDIDWIEAADYYVQLHVGDRSYLHREPMRDLEARLDPRRFMRIHRSSIVALDRIIEVRPGAQGDHVVRLRDGTELRLSRTRRARLRAVLAIRPRAATR